MSKHRVRNLRLREISSVDRPAQVGAVSVLIKRRGDDQPEDIIKATFLEALNGELLADKVRDAFYKSFENMWEGKDAFRKALVDELAAGGDGTTASTAFKAWLSGLVDAARTSAVAAGAANVPDELNKAFTEAATQWLEKQETEMKITDRAGLKSAITAALAKGDALTVAEVTTIQKAATDLKAEDELPASGVLAKAASTVDPALAAKVERMEKRDALSTEARAHYDGLTSDADRDAFLAKSADEQTAELAKAAGPDPVVYTTLDGVEIRKSAGDTLLALAKSADNDRRELAKARAQTEDVTLEKRAGDVLGNVGGEMVGKKALLKALDSITDEATRTAAEAVLKSANELGKGAFERRGSGPDLRLVKNGDNRNADGLSEAEVELDELAKAHAAEHKVDYATAYAAVCQTVEGAQLYKRAVEG